MWVGLLSLHMMKRLRNILENCEKQAATGDVQVGCALWDGIGG